MPVTQAAHECFELLSRGEPWRQYLSIPHIAIVDNTRVPREPKESPIILEQRIRNYLVIEEADTARNIANAVGVSGRWIAKVLRTLAKRGWIECTGAKRNRRWRITEKGLHTKTWGNMR